MEKYYTIRLFYSESAHSVLGVCIQSRLASEVNI
uniref:Uncharacterized protein n=1 Tax=Arundo donax TaxID=35708 RepID=A0A0A9B0B7_ARUDO